MICIVITPTQKKDDVINKKMILRNHAHAKK